jgi:hypothetical protein
LRPRLGLRLLLGLLLLGLLLLGLLLLGLLLLGLLLLGLLLMGLGPSPTLTQGDSSVSRSDPGSRLRLVGKQITLQFRIEIWFFQAVTRPTCCSCNLFSSCRRASSALRR